MDTVRKVIRFIFTAHPFQKLMQFEFLEKCYNPMKSEF
ncbi:hypothetical protein LEP1GSC017_3374 [Leptospira meyeri serovar Hardjo str. Went 5]|nr:hypothetical protein LEP1GSC017_3374 [Leptospira meyeri serovar Hardjo str. Went 5]